MNLSAPVWQKLMQPKALGVAGTFLIVVVVGVWWMTSNGATEPDEANLVALDQEFVTQDDAALTDQNGAAAVVSQTAQTIELAAQERADEVQESPPSTIIEPVKQEPAQSEPADSVARSDEDAESTVAMVQPPVAVPGQRRLTETGDDVLRLSFSEECWVEIKTTDGQLLFGDLGKAGQQREFVGAAPFKVLLGYAPGAMLEFNEEPVALSPHTRNNVASLVLGQ